jgi:hypothetical protein
VLRNYLDHRPWFDGVGNFNAEGFAFMERALPTFPKLIRTATGIPGLRLVYGTDAVAERMARTPRIWFAGSVTRGRRRWRRSSPPHREMPPPSGSGIALAPFADSKPT